MVRETLQRFGTCDETPGTWWVIALMTDPAASTTSASDEAKEAIATLQAGLLSHNVSTMSADNAVAAAMSTRALEHLKSALLCSDVRISALQEDKLSSSALHQPKPELIY